MNLFYAPDLSSEKKEYIFDKGESRHIAKVLRKSIGDILYITNGLGDLFTVKIADNNPNKTRVEIIESSHRPSSPKYIHIAIAPTKSIDRFEWFLEKAVEIGVNEITPILTEHSERKKINPERLERVIIAAMKQSLRLHKPILNPLTKWGDFIQNRKEDQKFIAYCKAEKNLSTLLKPVPSYLLCIGPEGGFSPQEIELAKENNFILAGLSKNRLRTETAGIVGLTSIQVCVN